MGRICPNCGEYYAEPPADGMCATCADVPLILKTDAADTVDAVAAANRYERGRLMTAVWVVAALVVAGLGGWLAPQLFGRDAKYSFWFLVVLLPVLFPTAATIVREYRAGVWRRRGFASRAALIAGVGGASVLLIVWLSAASGLLPSMVKQRRESARQDWVQQLARSIPQLDPCFAASEERPRRLNLNWANAGFSLGRKTSGLSEAERRCVNEHARTWPGFHFDSLDSVVCVSCVLTFEGALPRPEAEDGPVCGWGKTLRACR